MAQYTLHFAEDALVLEAPLLRGSSSVLRVGLNPESRSTQVSLEARSTALEHSATRVMSVYAILGIVELHRGPYLGVVTRARSVVRNGPNGAEICQIVAADFLPVPTPNNAKLDPPKLSLLQLKQEAKFLDMLHSVVETRTLYFSHNYDITQTAQRIALLGQRAQKGSQDENGLWTVPLNSDGTPLFTHEQSLAARADPRFFWNLSMSRAFGEAKLDDWVHPVICGYVAVRHHVPVLSQNSSGALSLTYLFISRRSRARQGTRFNLRGLDSEGNAANFVEIEQILLPQVQEPGADSDSSWRTDISLCSYIQTRGSIPTEWSQKVTTKYMPRVTLGTSPGEGLSRFSKHFTGSNGQHSIDHYGKATCINLVDRSGKGSTIQDQRQLGNRFKEHHENLGDKRLHLVWFDFHHECRKGKYENVSKLIKELHDDIDSYGFFAQLRNGRVAKWQTGVFRTNCMDSLDRTSVVQTVLARRHVFMTLEMLTKDSDELPHLAKPSEDVLSSPYASIDGVLQDINRANANTMSVLYAGTPALKTRRGTLGKLQDGLNSVTRYFLNNFYDGIKQDSFDLFLGEFKVSSLGKNEDIFAGNPEDESLTSVLTKLAFVFLSVFMLGSMSGTASPYTNVFTAFMACTTLVVIVITHALRKGLSPAFVAKPKFNQTNH